MVKKTIRPLCAGGLGHDVPQYLCCGCGKSLCGQCHEDQISQEGGKILRHKVCDRAIAPDTPVGLKVTI